MPLAAGRGMVPPPVLCASLPLRLTLSLLGGSTGSGSSSWALALCLQMASSLASESSLNCSGVRVSSGLGYVCTPAPSLDARVGMAALAVLLICGCRQLCDSLLACDYLLASTGLGRCTPTCLMPSRLRSMTRSSQEREQPEQ